MIVLMATLKIKPEHRQAFIDAMLQDAMGAVQKEPGCVRFDVLQDSNDPDRLHLYEVYRGQADFEAHMRAPHLLKWRETVKNWYAEPVEFSQSTNIFPPDDAWKDVTI